MNSGQTLKTKLLRNLGANAYGQAITVLIQLLSVPLYLHYWGVDLYGEWLILSAIPAYLALSDIGFGTVAANDMTIRVAKGDRIGALAVYQSIWVLVTSVSIFVGVILAFSIYTISIADFFSIENIAETEIKKLLAVLALYVLCGLQGNVFNAAFRSAGNYAYGTTLANTVRLAEWFLSMAVLVSSGGVFAVASITLVTRLFGLFAMWIILKKEVPWITLGIKTASFRQISLLVKPAIAFMAFPLGLAFSLQGMVIIIGMSLGPAAVVIFSAYRTLSRLLVQVITMINHSTWPEISAAYGSNQMDLVRDLHRKTSKITVWISFFVIVLMAIFGQWFVGIWTHHAFIQNQVLLILLLVTALFNVFWQSSWIVLMATNQHQKIALCFISSTVCCLLFSFFILPNFYIEGAGFILALAELPILYFAIKSALRIMNDSWSDYFKAVFSKPNLSFIKFLNKT